MSEPTRLARLSCTIDDGLMREVDKFGIEYLAGASRSAVVRHLLVAGLAGERKRLPQRHRLTDLEVRAVEGEGHARSTVIVAEPGKDDATRPVRSRSRRDERS
jgi:hypothetical protein